MWSAQRRRCTVYILCIYVKFPPRRTASRHLRVAGDGELVRYQSDVDLLTTRGWMFGVVYGGIGMGIVVKFEDLWLTEYF